MSYNVILKENMERQDTLLQMKLATDGWLCKPRGPSLAFSGI
jgi:hypothetical protein